VTDFLSNPLRDPRIENPNVRVPGLIRCNGVVHYTRSGTKTVVNNGNFLLQAGDFLVVAQACGTGGNRTIVAGLPPKDHVFIMPEDPNDPFAEGAQNFFDLRIDTNRFDLLIHSLDHLLKIISFDCGVSSPIHDIFIVSHALDSGLMFPVDDPRKNFLDYDELCEYIDRKNRPRMTERIIRNNASVNIRGCNIGRELRYLTKIRELFGNRVIVTAPKHFDYFGHWETRLPVPGQPPRVTTHRFEYMEYRFRVFSKVRAKRNSLIRLFLSRHFQDIHGTEISRDQFDKWVPKNIHSANVPVKHKCIVPIPNMKVNPEYRYGNRQVYLSALEDMNPADVPREKDKGLEKKKRLRLLRSRYANSDKMRANHPFPEYERFGYRSFNAFWDGLNWSDPQWNAEQHTLSSIGRRHEYELRIPITGPNRQENRLMLNAFLDPGGNQRNVRYLHHDIIETDARFFGIVP
jgi:hypothetical protein